MGGEKLRWYWKFQGKKRRKEWQGSKKRRGKLNHVEATRDSTVAVTKLEEEWIHWNYMIFLSLSFW